MKVNIVWISDRPAMPASFFRRLRIKPQNSRLDSSAFTVNAKGYAHANDEKTASRMRCALLQAQPNELIPRGFDIE